MADYEAPDIIADIDDDLIHARMLEELPDDIDKTEGGFAHDFTRPAALEKAEMLIAINDILQIFFPEWSYGDYLDMLARQVGLRRRNATRATGTLIVTGAPGTVIPAGFRFATPATAIAPNIEYEAVSEVTLEEGDNAVLVQCADAGLTGNTPANSITLMASPIGGIMTITNPEALTGGTEEEDDESLRARIMERDQNSESSFVGNNSDYKRWAQEVDGVGSVTVIPESEGPGSGTVKLIVMDSNGAPANQTILDAVYTHIMGSSTDDDARLAPVGAILIVTTAGPLEIVIAATVQLEEGYTVEEVTAAYTAAVKAYFEEAKAEGYVRYTRIGSVLSETAGILDYDPDSLMLNGAAENLSIGADDYPTIGEITLTEG